VHPDDIAAGVSANARAASAMELPAAFVMPIRLPGKGLFEEAGSSRVMDLASSVSSAGRG